MQKVRSTDFQKKHHYNNPYKPSKIGFFMARSKTRKVRASEEQSLDSEYNSETNSETEYPETLEKPKRKSRIHLYIILFFLIFGIEIFLIRTFSPTQIDDVSPGIPCEQSLLNKSDIFFVVPKFENKSIASNTAWCNQILATKKQLAIHGVVHNYKEFSQNLSESYIVDGMNIFKQCFGQNVTEFKPPQLSISSANKEFFAKKGIYVDGYANQVLHKVYHCNNSGVLPNWLIKLV